MPITLVSQSDVPAVVIDKSVLFFGRHPSCDVVLTDRNRVSRKHCCVVVVDNTLLVRDLGSMNGVKVNGKPIRRERALRIGDTLTVGDVTFTICLQTEEEQPSGDHFEPQTAFDAESPLPEEDRETVRTVPENEDGSDADAETLGEGGDNDFVQIVPDSDPELQSLDDMVILDDEDDDADSDVYRIPD